MMEPADSFAISGDGEALVSDFLPDRQGERFAPHAFDGALDRWSSPVSVDTGF